MEGKHEIRVRGRDFRAYRIGGAIVALLFGAMLLWQVVYLFQGYNVVVPEVAWGAVGGTREGTEVGNLEQVPSGQLASAVLRQRTELLRERYATGPAPSNPAPPLAVGPEERLVAEPVEGIDSVLYPRAWSTPDEQALAVLRPSQRVVGWTAVPYPNADIFERPDGRLWRTGISDYTTHIGALAILGTIALLGLVLAIRGRVPIAIGPDGRTVERFGFLERAAHWMTAGSFVALALTGIVIAFGTTLIGPVFGEPALGVVGWLSTWGHMIFAPPFFLGIVVLFVFWVLRNLPEPRLDIPWLVRLGGMMSDDPDNPPAKKFNAGQKVTFWVAVLGGLLMSVTGLTLMFPYFWAGIETIIWVMLAHAVIGLLMIAFFIGHAYIGTVGMQDAIAAMWNGRVDLNWAREHHELWLDELHAKGKLPPGVHQPGVHATGTRPPAPRRPATAPGRAVPTPRGREA